MRTDLLIFDFQGNIVSSLYGELPDDPEKLLRPAPQVVGDVCIADSEMQSYTRRLGIKTSAPVGVIECNVTARLGSGVRSGNITFPAKLMLHHVRDIGFDCATGRTEWRAHYTLLQTGPAQPQEPAKPMDSPSAKESPGKFFRMCPGDSATYSEFAAGPVKVSWNANELYWSVQVPGHREARIYACDTTNCLPSPLANGAFPGQIEDGKRERLSGGTWTEPTPEPESKPIRFREFL